MDAKKIDGKALAKKHEEALKKKLTKVIIDSDLRQNDNSGFKKRMPTIVSFCNKEDPPSVMYTNMKKQKAYEVGINFIVEEYTVNTSKDEIVEKIQRYNNDPNIDGIMMQLPIPEELNIFQNDFLTLIKPEKDVDGLVVNSPFLPATVKAVISILEKIVPGWSSKKMAVVGSEGEIGKPLIEALESWGSKLFNPGGWNVKKVDRNIGSLKNDLQDADIVISCVGQKHLIKPEMIKDGVVLIDVGLGDFDPGCFEKASLYTPKFGGVGPMTVISLMENAVQSYEKNLDSRL